MNGNSKPTLQTWLKKAEQTLRENNIVSARLDTQLLAAHAIRADRAWILAHGDYVLTSRQCTKLDTHLQKRASRLPLAYITGQQEFYGRIFKVAPSVLIPRPESEIIIDELKQRLKSGRILDIGTGSGCLAITASLEIPILQVEACDISTAALQVAQKNVQLLQAKVHFFHSDLLQNAAGVYDCIIANLPYVDPNWERSPETDFEPSKALFAEDNGLAIIKRLLDQAPAYLVTDGLLIIEADPRQHSAIINVATQLSLVLIKGFILVFQNATADILRV